MSQGVHKERRVPRGGTDGVVDGKLHERQEIAPRLKRGRVRPQDVFNGAICSLRLTIGLRMVRRGHLEPGAQDAKDGAPKRARESRIAIRNKVNRHPMMLEDSIYKDTCCLLAGDALFHRSKMDHFAKTVHKHQHTCVMVSVCRQTKDEVHRNGLPTVFRNRKWVQGGL